MFTVKDDAISPMRNHLERSLRRIPQAHMTAHRAASAHLHQSVRQAAEDAGLPTEPITVHDGVIGIDHSPEGDALADHEWGTPKRAPNPILRHAHEAAMPEAQSRYMRTLRQEMGF